MQCHSQCAPSSVPLEEAFLQKTVQTSKMHICIVAHFINVCCGTVIRNILDAQALG